MHSSLDRVPCPTHLVIEPCHGAIPAQGYEAIPMVMKDILKAIESIHLERRQSRNHSFTVQELLNQLSIVETQGIKLQVGVRQFSSCTVVYLHIYQ